MWKNPKVAMGLIGLLVALLLFVARPWVTTGAELGKPLVQAPKTIEPPARTAPASPPVQEPSASAPAPKIRVLGVAGYQDRQGRQIWRYLLESGELLTASQIAGRYGLSVREVPEGGVMRLLGQGVTYEPGGD